MKESIAILWDVENVTPSSKSLFVNGLLEYASELGRISVAMAYSDWTKSGMKSIAEVLNEHAFELIHVPQSRKNSSDITLITSAIQIIYQYPHIKKMVLVTGDADFRPLLQSMRKHGIETTIICDAKSASEDLLVLADSYRDFRDIISMGESDDSPTDSLAEEKDGRRRVGMAFPEAVELLKEAVQVLVSRKKPASLGAVKIRMRLLNPSFTEKDLHEAVQGRRGEDGQGKILRFRSWKDFVVAAVKADSSLELVYDEKDTFINLKTGPGSTAAAGTRGQSQAAGAKNQTIQIPEVIRQLLVAIRNVQKSRQSSTDTNPLVPYSAVSQYLIDVNVDLREHGYTRIRSLIEAAEKRDLVETHSEVQHWMTRLTPEGQRYC